MNNIIRPNIKQWKIQEEIQSLLNLYKTEKEINQERLLEYLDFINHNMDINHIEEVNKWSYEYISGLYTWAFASIIIFNDEIYSIPEEEGKKIVSIIFNFIRFLQGLMIGRNL